MALSEIILCSVYLCTAESTMSTLVNLQYLLCVRDGQIQLQPTAVAGLSVVSVPRRCLVCPQMHGCLKLMYLILYPNRA